MNSTVLIGEPDLNEPSDRPSAEAIADALRHPGASAVTVIEPPTGWVSLNIRELWSYRDLLVLLAMRDVSARFRQSVIGYGWAVLKPLVTVVIYTVVFSVLARIPTDPNIPYPIFVFSALIPWLYFSQSLAGLTSSIVGGRDLLSKVYFPRLILPLSSVAVGLIELGIQLVCLGGLMVCYRFPPSWSILALPVFVAITILTVLAFGIWLTALNVKYRDVGMAVPFLIQIWMYLCPIIYPISIIPERYRTLYALNPMVGVIQGFRWSLLGQGSPDWMMVGVSLAVVVALLISGLYYFRKTEITFADVI